MMKVLLKKGKPLQEIYQRNILFKKKIVENKVRNIVNDIKDNGDKSVFKYTKKFDNVKITNQTIKVTESEISGAFQNISNEFINHLRIIIDNVTDFYKKQKRVSTVIKKEGIFLQDKNIPMEIVGIYIPAGTAPLVSTVYMTVIPAKIAGVKRIVLITPPDKMGYVNPNILVVANLLKVNEIYKVGGAQAIAALAFGTKKIPKVDKIVGPGNIYVTEAKRQLYGYVDIDMLAGPTELVIIANHYSKENYIIADLEAQAEHIGGMAILITNSKKLMKKVKDRVSSGYMIYVKNMQEAIEITNKIAPEHLQIMTQSPRSIANKIKNAGAIFLGENSPAVLGDYAAGPSHVLPTLGTARFSSGVGIETFQKKIHIISYTKKALKNIQEPIKTVAKIEGLEKHYQAIEERFKGK